MIAIIDYGLGNLTSVKNALDVIGVANKITNSKKDIVAANGIIFPGVGAAGAGMENLRKNKLDVLLTDQIKKGKPFLGTCLGMQLLFDYSEEDNTKCLGIFKGRVRKFTRRLKIPQIGWNNIRIMNSESRIMEQIEQDSFFYFVNSYYCEPEDQNIIIGKTDYGITFASVIQKDNVFATQFHSEKSGDVGLALLRNFTNICV